MFSTSSVNKGRFRQFLRAKNRLCFKFCYRCRRISIEGALLKAGGLQVYIRRILSETGCLVTDDYLLKYNKNNCLNFIGYRLKDNQIIEMRWQKKSFPIYFGVCEHFSSTKVGP